MGVVGVVVVAVAVVRTRGALPTTIWRSTCRPTVTCQCGRRTPTSRRTASSMLHTVPRPFKGTHGSGGCDTMVSYAYSK